MLVNLNKVLEYAEKNHCAIGSFNTPNLENMMAVISAAEEKKCASYYYACRMS